MKRKLSAYLVMGMVLAALALGVGWVLAQPSPMAPAVEPVAPAVEPLAPAVEPLAPAVEPVGTDFTYQGYLDNNGSAANALFDFEFMLYDAAAGGNQIDVTAVRNNIQVQNGLFTVDLNFGASAFGQNARWLQIAVRPSGGGAFTTLSPRQELTPAPYALGLPNVYTNESQNFVGVGRNFRISGNEVFGVRAVAAANQYGGMYVETTNAGAWPFYGYATNGSFRAWTYYDGATGDWHLYNAGIRLSVPNEGGLRIGPSADYSLVISNTTGSDGIRILKTGDDAIQIGSAPDVSNYGVYIPSPGVSTYGIWSNTANASGEWAFYSVDNIQAGNVFAHAYSLVAKVTGATALTAGDVVAVDGLADPLPGAQSALPLVRLADDKQFTGVIGVVTGRLEYAVAPGKEEEGEMSLRSGDGPANPGDYVALTIYGVAEVKLQPGTAVQAGDRLTMAADGRARPLQTRTLEGMVVTEGAPIIGTVLETPTAGQDTIAVFVTLR
ncbi:MAG: DUF2190 family protein [Chloroflexi bacterium]|nr:DUF2190 family protein [Chloroflexota bacterium]